MPLQAKFPAGEAGSLHQVPKSLVWCRAAALWRSSSASLSVPQPGCALDLMLWGRRGEALYHSFVSGAIYLRAFPALRARGWCALSIVFDTLLRAQKTRLRLKADMAMHQVL